MTKVIGDSRRDFWLGFMFGATTAWVVVAFFIVRWAVGVK